MSGGLAPDPGYFEAVRPDVPTLPMLGGREVPRLIAPPDDTPTYLALDLAGPSVTV